MNFDTPNLHRAWRGVGVKLDPARAAEHLETIKKWQARKPKTITHMTAQERAALDAEIAEAVSKMKSRRNNGKASINDDDDPFSNARATTPQRYPPMAAGFNANLMRGLHSRTKKSTRKTDDGMKSNHLRIGKGRRSNFRAKRFMDLPATPSRRFSLTPKLARQLSSPTQSPVTAI
jgi:hypothetical protein